MELILIIPPPLVISLEAVDDDGNTTAAPVQISVEQTTAEITLTEVPIAVLTIPDGDRGDITVSDNGNTWALNKTFANGITDVADTVSLSINTLTPAP